ncbi:MAG: hypothetical protein II921_08165 [Treponema sp.]|nr:hypothetical protein [Treponema sp.]
MKFFQCLLFFPLFLIFASCGAKSKPVVIWTDCAEFASYVEEFNNGESALGDGTKAIVVYKEKLAESLFSEKTAIRPDLVIGTFLKNPGIERQLSSLSSLFAGERNENKIHRSDFYETLLESGSDKLIPVSFNLPMVIFSSKNNAFVSKDYMLSPNEIRDDAGLFNTKNKNGVYTKMGFAPSWSRDFLYLVAKMNRVDFAMDGEKLVWNDIALKMTVDYVVDWTLTRNTASSNEDDFSFKYLYTPNFKQVSFDRCLFAYSDSDDFFRHSEEQIADVDFRWICSSDEEPKIFVDDEIAMLGLHKKSANKGNAKKFIVWFFSKDTQKSLLERSERMNLGVRSFGICGGFSSIRSVNDELFPMYYKTLLGNLPEPELLSAPRPVPSRWVSLKERVVIPYLAEKSKTETSFDTKTMEERLDIWYKQFN